LELPPDVPEREFVITIGKFDKNGSENISTVLKANSQANRIGHEFCLANDEKSLVISLSIGPPWWTMVALLRDFLNRF
jgi:hypothetical protein